MAKLIPNRGLSSLASKLSRPLCKAYHIVSAHRALWHLLSIVSAIAVGTSAQSDGAEPGYYLSTNVGLSMDVDGGSFDILGIATGVDVELQFGPSATTAFGYNYGNNWRVEAAFGHTRADVGLLGLSAGAVELGEVRSNALMLNGYYDFRNGRKFQPYLGLGIGAIQSTYLGTSLSIGGGLVDFRDKDTSPGGQIILGLGYWVRDDLMLTAEYRYISTLTNAKYGLSGGNIVEERFDLHRLMLGVRGTF